MGYREFAPHPDLADIVACTWERDVPAAGAPPTRVLPDGCVDLVFRAGDLFVAGPDRAAVLSPVGAATTIVGLRLRPGAAGAVLGLPARELRDLRVGLDAVWGRAGAELLEQVALNEPAGRRHVLERAVLDRRRDMADLDLPVLAAARLLGRGTRVSELSDALATSERQLLRRFDIAVGYGPKTLDRVLRFQRFVSAIAARAWAGGFAHLAADLGYADQAHLTRECLRLSGLTPGRLAAARAPAAPAPSTARTRSGAVR